MGNVPIRIFLRHSSWKLLLHIHKRDSGFYGLEGRHRRHQRLYMAVCESQGIGVVVVILPRVRTQRYSGSLGGSDERDLRVCTLFFRLGSTGDVK